MIKLYHAPLTRSVRIYWLLEELGIPYELETVAFQQPEAPFAQFTPFGKLPAIEDGEVAMFESGAILEYLLERYGEGRLAPAPGSPQRAEFLQWVHFAEATAFPPLGNIAWHTIFRRDAERIPVAIADYRTWAEAALRVLEQALADRDYLVGGEFSGADIMMGYTLASAKWFGILTAERFPAVGRYLARLEARPAFQKSLQRPV
jgi:glutathione S-transferase